MLNEIKRGDIYFTAIPCATGHEMMKDRPAIVVSCEELNETSPCVVVVMCSASNSRELPEHITVRSTPVPSTALCEHIYTVDKSRLEARCGRCTDAEMAAVEIGIMAGLGMDVKGLARPVEEFSGGGAGSDQAGKMPASEELVRIRTERDVYRGMYERLLDSMSMERRPGA